MDEAAEWESFFGAMGKYVPRDARLMICQFRGDPNDIEKQNWAAKTYGPGKIDEGANVYVCVSAMKQNERGEYRRRKENFAGGLCLMIDDIGTGAGAKFSMDIISVLPCTALIETSKDNYQAVYMFDCAVTDIGLFERLIKGFIDKQFMGNDPGMAGVNRVFRPPVGVNGKPKHRTANGKQWKVRLASLDADRRYAPEALAAAFGVDLTAPVVNRGMPRGATVDKQDSILAFRNVRKALRQAKMLKTLMADMAGWSQIVCPWTDEHSGAANSGAAIREPNEENGWTGAFRCHHGHCADKGWRHLTEWVAEQDEAILEAANENAGEWEKWQ
jgi:hypothetical protein